MENWPWESFTSLIITRTIFIYHVIYFITLGLLVLLEIGFLAMFYAHRKTYWES